MRNVQGALALIGTGIIIGAVLIWIVTYLGATPKGLSVGPFNFEISTSQPQTPIAVPQQLPTSTREPQGPTLEDLGTLRVLGNSRQGIQIQVPKTGTYRFVYRSGAYSTYPINAAPPDTKTWLTAVVIFSGNKALWDGERIKSEDALIRLADTHYWATAEDAEKSAQGQFMEANFNQGDVLTLIGVDGYSAYSDNPGQIVVEWYFVNY
jgi:hypothetical protein